eukprot:6145198-Pyramimonas_sp.AAC.1
MTTKEQVKKNGGNNSCPNYCAWSFICVAQNELPSDCHSALMMHLAEEASDEPTFLRCLTRFTDDVYYYHRRHLTATQAKSVL